MNFKKGLIYSILAVICFSIITTFGVIVYKNGVSPLSVLIFRSFIACLLFFFTILFNKRLSFRIDKKDRKDIVISSLALSLYLFLFWQGVKELVHVPTIYAVYFTYPFWIMIISCLYLKQKFIQIKWVSLLLGTVGTFLAIGFLPSFSLQGINLYGIGLVLACALVWGGTILFNQRLFGKYDTIVVLFYNFLISFVVFNLFQNPMVLFSQIGFNSLFYLLLIAVVSTYLAFMFLSNAIKYFGGANWGITNLSSPIVNCLAAFIFLGQVVSYYQAFGIALSMGGVYLLCRAGE